MKKLILLFCLMTTTALSYAAEQVYFKIAVNENDYSTFLTDRISTKKKTLQYLATRMREPHFHPELLSRDYYEVKESRGIKYFDKSVIQYDVIPLHGDRFRHLLMVDAVTGIVIRKEVYDTNGKLVFSFTSLDRDNEEHAPAPSPVHAAVHDSHPVFKGYYMAADKELQDGTRHISFSDGLNKFSVFEKKAEGEPADQKRIMYGNYVFRKQIGKELYTVVGTIPFEEMERVLDNIVKLEEKK